LMGSTAALRGFGKAEEMLRIGGAVRRRGRHGYNVAKVRIWHWVPTQDTSASVGDWRQTGPVTGAVEINGNDPKARIKRMCENRLRP
jgi:hypothetical protein